MGTGVGSRASPGVRFAQSYGSVYHARAHRYPRVPELSLAAWTAPGAHQTPADSPGTQLKLGRFLRNDGVTTPTMGFVAWSSRESVEKLADNDSVQIDLLSQFEAAASMEVTRDAGVQLLHVTEEH